MESSFESVGRLRIKSIRGQTSATAVYVSYVRVKSKRLVVYVPSALQRIYPSKRLCPKEQYLQEERPLQCLHGTTRKDKQTTLSGATSNFARIQLLHGYEESEDDRHAGNGDGDGVRHFEAVHVGT